MSVNIKDKIKEWHRVYKEEWCWEDSDKLEADRDLELVLLAIDKLNDLGEE